jgi:hypothetical protein
MGISAGVGEEHGSTLRDLNYLVEVWPKTLGDVDFPIDLPLETLDNLLLPLHPAGCTGIGAVAEDEPCPRLNLATKQIRQVCVVILKTLEVEHDRFVPTAFEFVPDLTDFLQILVRV